MTDQFVRNQYHEDYEGYIDGNDRKVVIIDSESCIANVIDTGLEIISFLWNFNYFSETELWKMDGKKEISSFIVTLLHFNI